MFSDAVGKTGHVTPDHLDPAELVAGEADAPLNKRRTAMS